MNRYVKQDWRERMIPEEGVLSRQKMRRQQRWFRRKGHREIEAEHINNSRTQE